MPRASIQFKGHTFRKSSTTVTLPRKRDGYIRFAKITKSSERGVVTDWRYSDGTPVLAVEIENDGWSLTNMMYGKPFMFKGKRVRRMYLLKEGGVYTTTIPVPEKPEPAPYVIKEIVPEIL
jgi:hypothetical protein